MNYLEGQPAQVRRGLMNRRCVFNEGRECRKDRQCPQNGLNWTDLAGRLDQGLTTDMVTQVLALETLRQLALAAHQRGDKHRAKVRLAYEALDQVTIQGRAFGQQLVNQGAHLLGTGATQIELVNGTGWQRFIERPQDSRASRAAHEVHHVQGLGGSARKDINEIKTVLRIVQDQDGAFRLRQLGQLFADCGGVVLNEERLPAVGASLQATGQLEGTTALAAPRWRPPATRALAGAKPVDQLSVTGLISHPGDAVLNQRRPGVRAQIGPIVSLPIDT